MAERKAKEAEELAEKEKAKVDAAKRATVPVQGKDWMMVEGKKMRMMTVIVLTRARFVRGSPELFRKWRKIVKDLNDLIVNAESREGAKYMFRVKQLACNQAVSRYERRIEVINARPDIMDEEVTKFLETQLAAILEKDFEKYWVEGGR